MPISEADMAHIIANSFKDYHVKGFDYICLKRTPTQTDKVYMFDGDVSKMPEVVNPHDHRYDFDTLVMVGTMTNIRFAPVDYAIYANENVFHAYEYRTPLNGGRGFDWKCQQALAVTSKTAYHSGEIHRSKAVQLHTIRIHSNETALFLRQYEDVVPVDQPTMTYVLRGPAPSLSGLYSRFTEDEVLDRLRKLARLTAK